MTRIQLTDSTNHQQLSKQQQQVRHLVQHHDPARPEQRFNFNQQGTRPREKQTHSPQNVSHEQLERVFSRDAKVFPVDGDLGDEKGLI